MAYAIPKPADMELHKITLTDKAIQYARDVERGGDNHTRAKAGYCRAAIEMITDQYAVDICEALRDILDGHEALNGANDGSAFWANELDNQVAEELAEVRERLHSQFFDEFALSVKLDQVGRCDEVAKKLAGLLAQLDIPPEEHQGKFLSSIGIVHADIETLATALPSPTLNLAPFEKPKAAPPPPPSGIAPPPPPPSGIAPPPPPPPLPPVPPNLMSPEIASQIGETPVLIGPAEFQDAMELLFKNGGASTGELARSVEMTEAKMTNILYGKQKAKVDLKHARIFKSMCDIFAGKLAEAANIFGRVQG